MTNKQQKVCFVVMGFGKKTDYESGRTLDLDATYDAIIHPAVEHAGLRCIRADEVVHSGNIDTHMYEMLLRAELVIADISTGNVNAVYELGVRHALRPYSTIIMSEDGGRLYFDLNHISTFRYHHLGEDIGVKEAKRAKEDLQNLIEAALSSSNPDSPVYTYLPKLKQPKLSEDEYQALLDETEENQEHLASYIHQGVAAIANSDFSSAVQFFSLAGTLRPDDPFITQQLALATYKSGKDGTGTALINALEIIKKLKPDQSNDPETLGITGAIHKRLWETLEERAQLDLAVKYYGRGFEIRRDYYNGENLALCYEIRSEVQSEENEKLYDQMSASKTRDAVIKILDGIILSPAFEDRNDKKWVYATYAHCLYALNNHESGQVYEDKFYSESPAAWEVETFESSKKKLKKERTFRM